MVLVKVLFVSGRQLLVSTEEETIGQLVLRICEKLPQRPEGVLRLCYVARIQLFWAGQNPVLKWQW